jgi:hypothetical protein
VVERLLARADAVDPQRGRDYLRDKLATIRDRWNQIRTAALRLSYDRGPGAQQNTVPLLARPGIGRWDELTVGMSMRETESEINLLVPPKGQILEPVLGAPPWTFGDTTATQDEDDEALMGDELGEPTRGKH